MHSLIGGPLTETQNKKIELMLTRRAKAYSSYVIDFSLQKSFLISAIYHIKP